MYLISKESLLVVYVGVDLPRYHFSWNLVVGLKKFMAQVGCWSVPYYNL